MVYNVNDNNLFEHITKHHKIIWFLFKEGQEDSTLSIKPFNDKIESVNKNLNDEFPEVVFFQTTINENPKIMEYFGLNDSIIWDYKHHQFNPRIISVVNGQLIYDQSGKECYCLETLIKMVFDLHPELIPIPTSEG